jgi:hypothetical protein
MLKLRHEADNSHSQWRHVLTSMNESERSSGAFGHCEHYVMIAGRQRTS